MADVVHDHRAHARSSGCDRTFDEPQGQEVNIGSSPNFDSIGFDPQRIHEAEVAWRSLITVSAQDIVFEVVEHAESPSEVWRVLNAYLEPDTTSEKRRLHRKFNTMAMLAGENLERFRVRGLTAQLNNWRDWA